MQFKRKVAAWQQAAGSDLEKTASIFDTIAGLVSAGGGGSGAFPLSGHINKLIGAEAVGSLASSPMGTWSYELNKKLHGGVGGVLDRVKADEIYAQNLVGSAAKATSDAAMSAVEGIVGKLKSEMVDSPKRQAILDHLRKNDDIIGNADMNSVLEAYSSMSKFAPKLSTNLSAAKSFLREAVQHDGGIDYMTIKGLAQAEMAVNGRPSGN